MATKNKTVNSAVEKAQAAKIKTDKEMVQSDLKTLNRDVQSYVSTKIDQGKATAGDLRDSARDNLIELQNYGQDQIAKVEEEIRRRPGRSALIALAGGFVAGFLLRGSNRSNRY